MINYFLLFSLICSINSSPFRYYCHFDQETCLTGLNNQSIILFNATNDQLRQPASDVTSIQTSNNAGQCYFPYQIGSFQMYFCHQTDPNLPSTCPTGNSTGPKINCSEGEYGYHKFNENETGSYSYQLEIPSEIPIGDYCFRFYYYLSDGNSNGRIGIIFENSDLRTRVNQSIFNVSSYQGNRWTEIRQNIQLIHPVSEVYFQFERRIRDNKVFYFGIDEISIINKLCEPPSITTTTTTTTTTTSTMTNVETTRTCPTTTSRLTTTTTSRQLNTETPSETTTTRRSMGYRFNLNIELIVSMMISLLIICS